MGKRVVSGIFILIIIVGAGFIGRCFLFPLMLFCSLSGGYEYFKAVGIINDDNKRREPLFIINLVLCAAYYAVIFHNSVVYIRRIVYLNTMSLFAVFAIVSFIVFMSAYVFLFPKYDLNTIAKAVFGYFYTALLMSTIYLVYDIDGIGVYLYWLIFISSSVCDVFAYFVGIKIGKHRLAPVLSPKKSIEGSIGGVVGTILVAFLYGYILHRVLGLENNTMLYVAICAIASVVSQVGDLAASAIKRNYDIKDYSELIPGHGGILDRLDSCIFTAPVIYVVAYFVINLL